MLYFIPTPIGNLEDITVRSLEVLKKAEVIFCEDTRVTKKLLKLLEDKFSLNFGAKDFISMHSHNEEKIVNSLDITLFEKCVVYMSDAGMPCISDPGVNLVKFAQENSIEYEVLPGANAAVSAYAASGFEEKEFIFYGFLPHKSKNRLVVLQNLLASNYNVILYESPKRVLKLIDEICEIDPDTIIFLQKEISKLHQKSYKDNAKNLQKTLQKENLNGEWVVTIKTKQKQTQTITKEDILTLNIPKKQKAKLLSKITGEDIKTIYNDLINP